MFKFADSIHPDHISSFEFDHVAAYANGFWKWTPEQLARFPRHILIGVLGGQPEQARIARCLDMERYDAQARRDFAPFVQQRIALGHDDALGYSSILGDTPDDGIKALIEAMTAADLGAAPWRLWVAWWWGRPFPPTAAEVLAEIKALTDITLPVGRLAGCQWLPGDDTSATNDFDTSVWFIRDNFTVTDSRALETLARAA